MNALSSSASSPRHKREAEARDDQGALLAKAIGTFKLLSDRDRKGG
jgi:hypothetical protein